MLLKVIDWCGHIILRKDNEPVFYLERDNWNDNFFKTRYHLHLSGKTTVDGEPVWIGEVKILKKGQRKDDPALLEPGKQDFLDYRFCSAGQSIDYYQRLSEVDKDLRFDILSALRDIFIFPEILRGFEKEDGLELSLLHFIERDDDLFSLAPAVLNHNFDNFINSELSFKFHLSGMSAPVTFEFDPPEYGYHDHDDVASRVWVLTSECKLECQIFLSKFSKIAFASNEDRHLLEEEGYLQPAGIGFSKIICLSYGDCDTFSIPGIYLHEKEQIANDMTKGVGRFVFCGIYDLPKKMEESLAHFTIDTDGRVWENQNTTHQKASFQKTTAMLFEEFMGAWVAIEDDRERLDLLETALQFIQEDSSLQFIGDINFSNLTDEQLETFFLELPRNYQLVLHLLATFISKIIPRSLAFFDSPEESIETSLLSIVMKVLREVLEKQNSFMIVSTQSSEILSRTKPGDIIFLKKQDDLVSVLPYKKDLVSPNEEHENTDSNQ